MKPVCGHPDFQKIFLVQKVIWWSDNPIIINPHCVIFSFECDNMWSIRVDMLAVTIVGDFINCLRPKVLQNSRYIFVLNDILFASLIMYFFSCLNVEPFWCKFIFRSLEYAILRLTYWVSLNCLTVFLETLFDLEFYKQFQL